MKKIFLFLLFVFICISAHAQEYPSLSGYVVDTAQLIGVEDQAKITGWLRELEEKTTAQVAVVTVTSTSPETVEGYAVTLFKRWGIGQKKKDNGVLLVIAAKDRKLRIEVGYGLEGALTDALSSRIINGVIVPEFKAGNFSDGVTKGVWSIVSVVAKEYNVQISGQPQDVGVGAAETRISDNIWFLIFIFMFFVFRFFFWISPVSRRGGYWYGGGYGGGGGGFGGGFGGFGGGGSGGGGSSGGW